MEYNIDQFNFILYTHAMLSFSPSQRLFTISEVDLFLKGGKIFLETILSMCSL